MKTKTTTTTKIPLITSLMTSLRSSIISIKPIIMLVFIFVTVGIFISTTSKNNIQEGAGGIIHPTLSTNFFQRSASTPREKPTFLGELQDTYKKQEDTSKTPQQDTSKKQQQDTSKTPDTSKKQDTSKAPETGENLKEIIFSILAPLGTVIKLPDKTDIKIDKSQNK